MIKRITIRDVASYDTEGVVLDDLQRVNFIFGGNGTGKTTISRVLGEPLRELRYKQCDVEWDGEPEHVLVYNKDFREKQLKEYMPGVFTLGQQWVDFDKKMDKHRRKRMEISERVMKAHEWLVKLEQQQDEAERKLQDLVWEKAYVPHQDFKECLKGYDKKASFLAYIRKEIWRLGLPDSMENVKYKSWQVGPDMSLEQLREMYHELYEGPDSKIGPDNAKSGGVIVQREMLASSFWHYLALLVKTDVMWAEQNINDIKKWQERREREYDDAMRSLSQIDSGIDTADSMIRSQQPTIDRINNRLKMMGFAGFSIKPSPGVDSHYQIQRDDGSFVNQTLSEGEAMLISFLYFMELVKGREIAKGVRMPVVMVIDDPISSMDSKVMYEVVMMIRAAIEECRSRKVTKREVLEDGMVMEYYDDPYESEDRENWIEQVIVLTHNTAFHKAVSDLRKRRDTHYWKLTKKKGVSKAKPFGTVNPVKGEYEELWGDVRSMKEDGRCDVTVANVMRRIIETYFVGFGGYDKRKLFAGEYAKNDVDKLALKSFAKWFDEGSHRTADDISLEEGDERCFEAFEGFFVKMGHGEHYKMMMREE